jgi:2-polyprenyl-6-methoxyphenol hydroxylase-like FAD-dependent oxidoreductase
VEIPETVVESGLMYVTRWYRDPGHEVPVDAKLGGDLGFVKFLGIPGDGGTLSVTLAVRTEDRELRQALADPDRFDLACQLLPGPDTFFRDGPLDALTPVLTMSGLLNRIRRFVDDDRPRVLGFLALGDAHTTTNPLYGRGCSLAAVQATLLVDALADHPAADPTCLSALALRYEADSAREIEPWYEASVQMDKMGADPTGASALRRAGADGDAAKAMGAVFAAAASDPVIGRAIAKLMNLLIKPADMMADPEFLTAAAKVMADPDAYPAPAQSGPSRAELLVSLTDAA